MAGFNYGYKTKIANANYTADVSQSFVLYKGEIEIARGNRKHIYNLCDQLRRRNTEESYKIQHVGRSISF